MNIYGFGSTTDLGKRDSYFSCKNWSSKVYTSFVKVVVLVIQSTTKLVVQFLDFSTILYGFYKTLDQEVKLKNLFLLWPLESLKLHTSTLPSSRKDPGEFLASQPCPPVAGQARRRRGRLGVVNKRGGWLIKLTCARSAAVAWSKKSPAIAGGEAVAARPPRLGFWWRAGEAKPSSVCGSSGWC
jgi:hypothetical protein